MKITKAELIELDACEEGLARFITQTGNTDEPVEVASLVGGENTYSDLLWLAGEKLPKERIVRFACDCALVNIELIKPHTDKYDKIVEFLRNRTCATVAYDAAHAAHDAAARAYAVYGADAIYAKRAAARAARAATCAAGATDVCGAAIFTYDYAIKASNYSGKGQEINKLLKELFA